MSRLNRKLNIAWVVFVGTIFVLINAEVGMRKAVAVVAIGLSLAWGGVQAKSFDDGVELGAKGMQTGAYLCFAKLKHTLKGYELKHLKDKIEEDFKSRSDLHPMLVESYRKGFQIEGLDDPALEVSFKECIDQEVGVILKAVDR